MPDPLKLTITYPGITNCLGFTYVLVHGTSPGVIQVRMLPQVDPTGAPILPAEFGDFTFSDGVTEKTVQDCRFLKIESTYDTQKGVTWIVSISDGRWRWRNGFGSFSGINGWYNPRDTRGELDPPYVRSPNELAVICLNALGITDYTIDLPPGLASTDTAGLEDQLFLGERLPPTNTNPEMIWARHGAADALQMLCDQFGARVIYDPFTKAVRIAPLGVGQDLPPGGFEMRTEGLDNPQVPDFIGVTGAPLRIQMKVRLRAVAKEWDGYMLPIDSVSYAPPRTPQTPLGYRSDWRYSFPPDFSNVIPTDRLSYFQAKGLAQESVFRWYKIVLDDTGNGFGGPVQGQGLQGNVGNDGGASGQPTNPIVPGKLKIPYYDELYGTIKRRRQLTVQSSKVEQVTPKPNIAGGQNQGNPIPPDVGAGILAEMYDGKSRDQQATVNGSIASQIGSVFWFTPPGGGNGPNRLYNTLAGDRVYVPFTIVKHFTGEEFVVFAEPVYEWDSQTGAALEPELWLETAFLVRSPDENQYLRWEQSLQVAQNEDPTDPNAAPAGVEWHRHDDLQVGIVGLYDIWNNLVSWKYADGDLEYAAAAGNYYLAGHAYRYQVANTLVMQYPRFLDRITDPYVQMIEWSYDGSGCQTVASANNEHQITFPDYPRRRRNELLPPDRQAFFDNLRERAFLDRIYRNADSNIR